MKHIVFVYGTLKRGYGNHHFLRTSTFVCEAVTKPVYCLYDDGSFPYLVASLSEGVPVYGEVFEVDDATLARLDRLEGVPHHYERKPIALDGCGLAAEAYFVRTLDNRSVRKIGSAWPEKVTN